jgi:hypothetical protein
MGWTIHFFSAAIGKLQQHDRTMELELYSQQNRRLAGRPWQRRTEGRRCRTYRIPGRSAWFLPGDRQTSKQNIDIRVEDTARRLTVWRHLSLWNQGTRMASCWCVHGGSLVLRCDDRALYDLFGAAKLPAATAFAA